MNIGIKNQGTAPTIHSPGDTVLRIDLSPLVDYESAAYTGLFLGARLDCSIDLDVLTCVIESQNFDVGGLSRVQVTGHYNAAGEWTLPAAGGECLVDPDNLIGEADEFNNECTVDYPVVTVAAAPAVDTNRLLGVSMWTNLAYVYDRVEDNFVNVVSYGESDGTPLHALDDIVHSPVTGDLYVFHRRYQSATHRLGIFDPSGGVTDIGDTGVSFHDSAITADGTLYAVGRNGTLYEVDHETAAVTALCDTGYGSGNSTHSALAWDSDAGELLQIISKMLIVIDLSNLPVNSVDACPSTASSIDAEVNDGIFAAEYVDGELLVAINSGRIFVVGRNGAALEYGDELPSPFHGLVADPGALPVGSPPCPADALLSVSNSNYDSSLFAVDLESGELTYVATVPLYINSMDLDPASGHLIASDQRELFRIEPCTGEVISQLTRPDDPGRFSAIDIDRSGSALAYNTSSQSFLYQLDLNAGSSASLGSGPRARIMTVLGGKVVHEAPYNDDTASIGYYSLSGYPTLNESLPLFFGPGLEPGDGRQLVGSDVRFLDNALFGVLQRVKGDGSSSVTTARANTLVMIDENGNVTPVADLPAGAFHLTIDVGPIFSDGFEYAVEPD